MNSNLEVVGKNVIEAPEEENSFEAHFNGFMEEQYPDASEEFLKSASFIFYNGAASLFEALEAIQPLSNKLSSIITSAAQLANLRQEIVDFLEGEEEVE